MRPMMLIIVVLAIACPSLSRAADTAKIDSLLKESVQRVEELGNALETVKDKESAKTAAPTIEKIWDRAKAIGDELRGLQNKKGRAGEENKKEQSALQKKYESQLKLAAFRAQKVAFAAAKAAEREPSFVKIALRMKEGGFDLPNLTDKPENKAEPDEVFTAARLLSHLRGSPVVALGLSLDEQSKIFDRLLQSSNAHIRTAATKGKAALLMNRAVDIAFENKPLEDFFWKQIDENFKRDDPKLDDLFDDFKKGLKAFENTRNLEAHITGLITKRDNTYRGIFEWHLLPLVRELSGPVAKAPMIEIRSTLRQIKDANNPSLVLGSRPCVEIVNICGKKLQNVVVEVEIEAGKFVDNRCFYIASLNKNATYELAFRPEYHDRLGSPVPTLISYSLWCSEGSDINQVLGGRVRLNWEQLKAAARSKEVLFAAVESRAIFRGEMKQARGDAIPVEFSLERVKKDFAGAADIHATIKSKQGTRVFEGSLATDNAGGFRLTFYPFPYNPSMRNQRYYLSVDGDALILKDQKNTITELRRDPPNEPAVVQPAVVPPAKKPFAAGSVFVGTRIYFAPKPVPNPFRMEIKSLTDGNFEAVVTYDDRNFNVVGVIKGDGQVTFEVLAQKATTDKAKTDSKKLKHSYTGRLEGTQLKLKYAGSAPAGHHITGEVTAELKAKE